jgi:hypothetical protein
MPLPPQCKGDDPCPFKKRLDAGDSEPGKCPDCGQDSRDEPAAAPRDAREQ